MSAVVVASRAGTMHPRWLPVSYGLSVAEQAGNRVKRDLWLAGRRAGERSFVFVPPRDAAGSSAQRAARLLPPARRASPFSPKWGWFGGGSALPAMLSSTAFTNLQDKSDLTIYICIFLTCDR